MQLLILFFKSCIYNLNSSHFFNVLEGNVQSDRVGARHRLRIDVAVGLGIEIAVVVRGDHQRVAGFEVHAQSGHVEFACDSLREGVSQPDAVHAEVVDLSVPDVEAVEQVDVCREIVHDPVIDPVRIGILVPVAPGRTVGLQVARERRIGSRGVGRRPHLVHFGGVVLPGVGLRGVVEGRARHELSENEVARDRQVEILVVEPVVETSRHIRVAGTDVGLSLIHI